MTTTKHMKTTNQTNIFIDIWSSFRTIPGWVQIWMMFILIPVNLVTLFFINKPMGGVLAFLAIIGMAPNIPIILKERGVSKAMAIPHLLPWTILVIIILFFRPAASGSYAVFLVVLLVINLISLVFDYRDALAWLKGDRAIAGRQPVS